jgi:hypothetical protein
VIEHNNRLSLKFDRVKIGLPTTAIVTATNVSALTRSSPAQAGYDAISNATNDMRTAGVKAANEGIAATAAMMSASLFTTLFNSFAAKNLIRRQERVRGLLEDPPLKRQARLSAAAYRCVYLLQSQVPSDLCWPE